MPINIAARRGARNQRRKAAVAAKRRAEIDAGTMSGRVRLALADPIQQCLLSQGLFEFGVGTLIVARGATPYRLTMAAFVLDTYAFGVKDAFFRSVSAQAFDEYKASMSLVAPFEPVDPAYARKLLHDLVTWARSAGFPPHRDYPKLEPIFGGVAANAGDAEFRFGFEGKPLLVGDEADIAEILSEWDIEITADADGVGQLGDQVTPEAAD